ncbi:hypothetical protein EIP91_000579 [Steccherinum ochraceum]|uniref:SH3 domain-containing protein n=1 Tax=Steccherinum ochraceum TaxID=92696 RepID=A0A4R0RI04_9APHY|nr:hypothetical protein EIP91_000579 [Steccherinum ochraceum]
MSESALLAHIVSQTKANISFLAAQNHITQADASTMLSRLDAAESRGITSPQAALANSIHSLSVSAPRESTPVASVVTPPPARRDVPAPPSRLQKAKALWAYNEDGQEPNDLSFSSGEIVEIVDETNADWWTGKCRGKQGLFPSNHVEKIAGSAPSPSPSPAAVPVHAVPPAPAPSSYAPPAWSPPGPPMPSMPMPAQSGYPMSYQNEKAAPYPPYGAPPPPGPGPGYGPPPGAPAPIVVEGHKDKKKKFGGDLGKTMATAAAGGVGFGAGAAIGGGIIDAIF